MIKLLEFIFDNKSTIYIGNEFSPDPLDMLQKIQSSAPGISTKELFTRRVDVIANDSNQYHNVYMDVKNLLAKNGYVEYNPCTVKVTCKRG